MKIILKEYIENSKHLEDQKSRALHLISMLEVLVLPKASIHEYGNVEETLRIFMQNKSRKYVIALLRHFIENGDFDYSVEKIDTVYNLDNFKELKEMLIEVFIVEETTH
jgi:hypothetical protein